YSTQDGTCVRDFIHVDDLASAHIQALHYLENKGKSVILNCGYGKGYSVQEVITALETICQRSLPVAIQQRRQGDIAHVVADNALIKKTLNWHPQYDDIHLIVK
ncbi:MAG TPA: NAD-dependent epimerase/dehydratase family protein, partial [Candidatus Berkiella sp.]|nr:NAD-dependent epimerase/dehydratase family protein [Candidatus Berkiella sp.]